MSSSTFRSRASVLAALATAAVLVAAASVAQAVEDRPSVSGVVNLNTASSEELQILPGIGESRAVAILAMRKERGGFKKVDELLEVKGIGTTMLDRLRPYVTLSGKTTARKL